MASRCDTDPSDRGDHLPTSHTFPPVSVTVNVAGSVEAAYTAVVFAADAATVNTSEFSVTVSDVPFRDAVNARDDSQPAGPVISNENESPGRYEPSSFAGRRSNEGIRRGRSWTRRHHRRWRDRSHRTATQQR